jgi:hypothetical protein
VTATLEILRAMPTGDIHMRPYRGAIGLYTGQCSSCNRNGCGGPALSIMVFGAFYTVTGDMLRLILAPYGVQWLVVNPRATTRKGSHYLKAIVQLRSRDEAARPPVSLHGKYLFEECCYLDVKFALPYELGSMATSTKLHLAPARLLV